VVARSQLSRGRAERAAAAEEEPLLGAEEERRAGSQAPEAQHRQLPGEEPPSCQVLLPAQAGAERELAALRPRGMPRCPARARASAFVRAPLR